MTGTWKPRAGAVTVAALALGVVAPLAARTTMFGESHRAAAQQDWRWSGQVPAGEWIEVKGVNGDVRAERASGNQVVVTAVRRAGRRGRVEDVRIERIEHEDGVTICAVYPSREGREPNRCTAGENWNSNVQDNDVEVDFVVQVPRGVHFRGATVNGEMEALSMPADAIVSTVNGSVSVSAAGVVEAVTVNGSIDATTGVADPDRNLEFRTVNGSITLNVPRSFGARFRASVLNGNISSDFPVNVNRGRYVGARASGEFGDAGRTLRMETINGNIRLRRAGS
jgi:hypothetical protein